MAGDALNLDKHGAERAKRLTHDALAKIERAVADLAGGHAGIRLHGIAPLQPLLAADGPIGSIAATRLGDEARPVRAILFDKSAQTNWSLGWHQDRTIAVTRRVDTPGFGPWTRKAGMIHVEPPFAIIEAMLTLRVHLDPVTDDNAPLLIAPGSHLCGRIEEARIAPLVEELGDVACLAQRGDIWIYATPILHASARSRSQSGRRVLQVDYAAQTLPGHLEWLGI